MSLGAARANAPSSSRVVAASANARPVVPHFPASFKLARAGSSSAMSALLGIEIAPFLRYENTLGQDTKGYAQRRIRPRTREWNPGLRNSTDHRWIMESPTMEFWSSKSLKSFFIPGGFILLGAVLLIDVASVSFSQAGVGFFYYAVVLAGELLGWRFHSKRILFSVIILLLGHH